MNPLIVIGIAPLSWRMGLVRRRPGKVTYAFGPFRVIFHNLNDGGVSW